MGTRRRVRCRRVRRQRSRARSRSAPSADTAAADVRRGGGGGNKGSALNAERFARPPLWSGRVRRRSRPAPPPRSPALRHPRGCVPGATRGLVVPPGAVNDVGHCIPGDRPRSSGSPIHGHEVTPHAGAVRRRGHAGPTLCADGRASAACRRRAWTRAPACALPSRRPVRRRRSRAIWRSSTPSTPAARRAGWTSRSGGAAPRPATRSGAGSRA